MARRLTNWILWTSLAAFAATVSLQKIRSFDYWWHLKTGELIAQTGAIPRVDPYSFSAAGAPWIDIHWLFQLTLSRIHSFGGHDAVVLAKLGLVLLLLVILGAIGFRRERPFVTVAALALLLLAGSDRFMPRPELLSFVLLACHLMIFDRFDRHSDAWIYAVIPLQLVWVNIHGLFALGIAVCAIHLVAEGLSPLLRPGRALDRPRVQRLAIVTVLAIATSLLNPYGVEAALYPLEQLKMIGTADLRALSPQTRELATIGSYWPRLTPAYQLVLVATLLFSLLPMAVSWRKLRIADLLLWLAFLALAVAAQRNITLFAIVSSPIAVRSWNELLDRRAEGRSPSVIVSLVPSVLLIGLSVSTAGGHLFRQLGALREPGVGVMEIIHPVGAVRWIAENQPGGPIFHSMIDGGYVTWKLYPGYLILADGRLEVFGPERRLELNALAPRSFLTLDDRYHFGVALLNHGHLDYRQLIHFLHESAEWRLVLVDDSATLFVREPNDFPVVDVDNDSLFRAIDEHEDGVLSSYRRRARIRFFRAVGENERARAVLAEAAGLHRNAEPSE
jgi:hypothetical protein